MVKHLNIRVYGRVQGVYFRGTAKETAIDLYIKGFARNENDGTVYIEAEGEEAQLKEFLEWCHLGSPRSKVEKVISEQGEIKNYMGFDTAYAK